MTKYNNNVHIFNCQDCIRNNSEALDTCLLVCEVKMFLHWIQDNTTAISLVIVQHYLPLLYIIYKTLIQGIHVARK